MSEFFFLLKNKPSDTYNQYMNLINNSFSQQTYNKYNGYQVTNGYIYRPALRMQFSPFLYNTADTSHVSYFYPSKIKIMKKSLYNCDILSDNIKIKYQTKQYDSTTKNYCYRTYNSTKFNGYQVSLDSVKSEVLDTTNLLQSSDRRNTFSQHGIQFNEIVGYQVLNFIFDLSIDQNSNLVQNINCFSDDPTSFLYTGSHIVLTNIQNTTNIENNNLYNCICNLYYKYSESTAASSTSNNIYAVIHRPIAIYKQFISDYKSSKQNTTYLSTQSRLTVYFPNFNSQSLIQQDQNSSSSVSSSSYDAQLINTNIFSDYNSIQYNYYMGEKQGYISLMNRDSDLHIYYTGNNGQTGTWTYDSVQDDLSYFTRSYKDTTTGIYSDQKDVSDSNTSSQAIGSTAYSSKTYSTNTFAVNRPQDRSTCQKYVLYWDYTKKDENGDYVLSNISGYFNQPILFMVQFKTWFTSGGQLQHDTSTHYLHAFGYIDDYHKKSSRPIYLLNHDGQDYRQFLLNGVQNSIITTSQTNLKGQGFSKYINKPSQLFCNVKQSGDQFNNGIGIENQFYKIKKYRYSQTQFSVNDSDIKVKWHEITNFNTDTVDNANLKIVFEDPTTTQKQIWLQIADNQFNVSKVIEGLMTVYQVTPYSQFIKITGTNKSTNYTGIQIDSVNGQFKIDNSVNVQFSAVTTNPDVQLFYKITGDIYDQYIEEDQNGNYVTKKWSDYKLFSASDNLKTVHLIPSSISPYSDSFYAKQTKVVNGQNTIVKKSLSQGCLTSDALKSIIVTFRDSAGNTLNVPGTIYMNTKLFKTSHKNLRQPSSSYDLQLYKNQSGAYTLISRTDSNKASTYRKWNDIFYPTSHSYPTLANGSIDVNSALNISSSNTEYDPVVTSNGQIVYDSNGRVTTIWNNSKKYPTMVSSYDDLNNTGTGFTYWIIDNTGYGDITLQFEYFYLDTVAYGPPYNQMLGKNTPDILAIYDASDPGCVTEIVDSLGQTKYILANTTLLKRLQRYTGYADKTMSVDTGTVNASAQGTFITETFGTERLCLIFYSDCQNSNNTSTSPIGSGFKIKAAKPIVEYWQNFDVDTTNGLVWVHMSSNVQGVMTAGESVSKLNLTYDYYNTSINIDYQDGSVIFDEKPSNDVYATYSYYDYNKDDIPPSRDFMADGDDMVDYADLNVYFVNQGTSPTKTRNVTPLYPSLAPGQVQATYDDGKLVNYYSTDKDRGVIQFNNGTSLGNQFSYVPRGRLFADYRYHTYQRLANDGYSDFEFNDSILVADTTTKYPDYTWGDIKIVNEGDAALQAGQIKFLARGVVTDNVITQVLDINRPWDVQSGTAQETYGKTGCQVSANYKWDSYSCTRAQAKAILSKSTVNQFNVDQFESKGILYGRIVLCLGGTNDSYPTTTAGKKVFSSQIAGKFYQQE